MSVVPSSVVAYLHVTNRREIQRWKADESADGMGDNDEAGGEGKKFSTFQGKGPPLAHVRDSISCLSLNAPLAAACVNSQRRVHTT